MTTSFFRRVPDFEIVAMDSEDCSEAATLHATGFSRGWTDGELQALLVQEPVFGYTARRSGKRNRVGGFVLARLVEGEAEILTIVVSPKYRRSGIGWRLMGAAIRHLRTEGAVSLFLEVDESNLAALSLYEKLGFQKVAERAAYYHHGSGTKAAALVMRLDLG